MITTTTKRGKRVKLLTLVEWYEFMHQHHDYHGQGVGLMAFDQAVWQSRQHKVCIDCLSTDNLVECKNLLLPTDGYHSKDYYMCQDCLDYYNSKG